MSMNSVYKQESFSGETAHPKWLKRAGLLSGFIAVVTVALGVADTMMAATTGELPSSAPYVPINFVYVGVGIWGSIPAFLTGLLAVYAVGRVDGSNLRLSLTSFLSSAIFLPALVGITSLEIKQLRDITQYDTARLPQRYGIAVAILVMGLVNFLINVSIMIIVCFCTYAPEEETSLVTQPTSGTTSGAATSPTACGKCAPVIPNYNFAPTNVATPTTQTHYKVMQLFPTNFTALPNAPNHMVTNIPMGYQNLGYKIYGK